MSTPWIINRGAGKALPYSTISRIKNVKEENNFAIVIANSGKNY